ncbi:flavin-containing monooxygenase 5-like isoform X1 [Stegodyphus dumicola]|uniref:flavin-containing monooxygenase 5-like isoform X1 n=2 Tax=Stegodyphus dumicola TaxID=202533 RepID=UPI0015AD5704|nr:flavin-containing monooxygenase 5-like isoform X1 [Stegodyphus dumicola]
MNRGDDLMTAKMRILVIGAGVSGLTAIKACKEENFDVVCYEKTGEFGGLWRYHDSDVDGLPSVMKSTISNSSKEMSSFSDFPPSSSFPTYMHHSTVLKYLEMYAEHFGLLGHITYYQEVVELIPAEDYGTTGRWVVKIRDLHTNESREETFDGVMACIGHHAYPYTPSYSNMDLFSGRIMHSHTYKTFTGMEDKSVLVVGAGNSGADIAAEISNVAKKVYLSTRRGSWIFPRLFEKGKPMDICLYRRYKVLMPANYFAKDIEKTLTEKMDHKRFGIKPYHPVTSQHPTINDEIQAKLLTGMVTVKRDIKEFSETGVIFVDEEETTPIDVVIFATGYQVKFPFLSDDILRVGKNNKVFLYKNVFPPQLKHHTLGVIGLIQPSGSLFPIFEMQTRWFVALMAGKCRLPSTETMLQDVKKTEGFRVRNFVQSPRHSVEVAWLPYIDEIAEMFGAKPHMAALFVKDPKLFKACFFGPCLPYQFRLNGPHKWDGARDAILNYKDRMYEHLKTG